MRRHVVAICSTLLATTGILAADWPVFRGNRHQTGVATETLPDKLALRWSFPTGDAIPGTPAIVNGVAYVGSLDGSLYAVDLANGKQKWKFATGAIKAPVGSRGGFVYAGNEDGLFHCVDAVSGKPVWKFEAGGEITSGPAFAGEFVLFGSADEHLHCLNRSDGKEKWKFQVAGGPVMGTPIVIKDRTFTTGCDSVLHELNLSDGKEVNRLDLGGQVASSIATAGDKLFVTTMSSEVIAIDAKKLAVAWRFEGRKRQPFYSSPAVTDKFVIAAARDGRVYAIDRDTGKESWTYLADKRIDGSAVVAGSRVYVASFDKNLYVLDLATGKEVQKLPCDSGAASPAVSGGRLLIGTEKGHLHCFGSP